MVVRITPQEYFKRELKTADAIYLPPTTKECSIGYVNSNTGVDIDGIVFKYVMVVGLTIVSVVAIKYFLEK